MSKDLPRRPYTAGANISHDLVEAASKQAPGANNDGCFA